MLRPCSTGWRRRGPSSRRHRIRRRRSTCSPSCRRSRRKSKRRWHAPSERPSSGRPSVQTADGLRDLVERGVEELAFSPDLGTLEPPMRYALGGGGKRLRPVLCLATAEALGVDAERALPAALAIELVHTFSIVHDDLPALDDDELRRGRATVH